MKRLTMPARFATLTAFTLAWAVSAAGQNILYDNGAKTNTFVFSDPGAGQTGRVVADRFSLTGLNTITGVNWTGVYAQANTPGTSASDNFTIGICDSAGAAPAGIPGSASCTPLVITSLVRTKRPTTIGQSDLYSYSAQVTPVTKPVGSVFWLFIVNDTSGDIDDNWAWAGQSDAGNATVLHDLDDPSNNWHPGIVRMDFQLTGQFAITTASLPTAIYGQPYTPLLLETANGLGPVVWSFVSGNFPPGFVVGPGPVTQSDTTGTFCYGFTTQVGPPACIANSVLSTPLVYAFTLQARSQSTAQTATRQYTLAVVPPLQFTTTTLPDAAAGQNYNFQIKITGGTGQFTWSILSGALPRGITLDPATGLLSGTAPNVIDSFPFVVQVLDQVTQATVTQQFRINVLGGIGITTPAVLPNAIANQPYSIQLEAASAAGLVWSVSSGWQLPQNFTLSTSGLLTGFGLTSQVGTYMFQIQLTNPAASANSPPAATKIFTLSITLGSLGITCARCSTQTTLPNATQGVAYNVTLVAAGGIPPYTWSFDTVSPQNLSINRTTGVITGTPPNAGAFPIPVTLKDSTGSSFSQTYTLTVFGGVTITKTSLAPGSPGAAYSDTLTATGGSIPYRWEVTAGNLPTGLSLQNSNSVWLITGTPTVPGTFQFTLQITDAVGSIANKVFTITIGAGTPLTITTVSLPNGSLNQSYSQTVVATGGTAPYTWTIASGALPPPLALNPTNGVIFGTPSSVGSFAFDVLVTDAVQTPVRKTFSINITNPTTPVVIVSGNLTGTVLTAFSQTLAATGGTPPYTWSIPSGTPPTGLQLDGTTGVISGTPGAAGTNTLTFTATDANGQTGSKTITIAIVLPPAPTTSVGLGTGSQPTVSLSSSTPYPLEITGFLTLTFNSSFGQDDMVRFSNGSRSLEYIIRANQTQAIFPTAANAAIVTGTTAGTITLTVSMQAGGQDLTPPAPTTRTIDPGVPVITAVALNQVSGGLSVVVTGYSNTHEVSSGSFTFAVSGGNTLSQSQLTVALTSAYTTWFNNTASNATGGQFKLTLPFSVTGNAAAVTKVGVTLTNSRGTSAAVSSP